MLQAGDKLEVRNRMREVIRLKYKGEYVDITGGGTVSGHYFYVDGYPVDANDYQVGRYTVSVYDYTRGRQVDFPVDLTLSNQVYRSMIGRVVNVNGMYGYTGTLIFKPNLTWEYTDNADSSIKTGTYTFNHGHSHTHNYVECQNFTIDKRLEGYVYLNQNVPYTAFDYIMVYEDGTLSGNSYYACPEFMKNSGSVY